MPVTREWSPYEGLDDRGSVTKAVEERRRFVKGSRFNLGTDTPIASLASTDTGAQASASCDVASRRSAAATGAPLALPCTVNAADAGQDALGCDGDFSPQNAGLTLVALYLRGHGRAMPKPYNPYAYIIRLEARILGVEPAITRTSESPSDLNFAQLHEVLQAAFGWTDSHLHQFHVGGSTIGAPEAIEDTPYGPRVFEATEVQLK
ncbi:hypothetical protein OY671_008913, partial [Metschnikowia pulcherrima]